MSKILRCEKCNTKVADVRDASLIKGLVCYCEKCHKANKQKIAAAHYYAEQRKTGNPIKDVFGDIFR